MRLTNSLIAISVSLLIFSVKIWDAADSKNIDYQGSGLYYLKAKVDGKWIEFNQDSELSFNFGPFIDIIYDGVINASNLDSGEQSIINSITIMIRQSGKIEVGSYSGGIPFEYGFKGVTMSYTDSHSSAMYVTDLNRPQSFLKISELTDTFIKGTFSGELVNIMSKSKISITDGEFYIRSNPY